MKNLRKHSLLMGLLLGLVCLAVVAGPAWAGKTAWAESYNSDLLAQADGSLQVTETVVFRYEGGPFTFVNREIPIHRTDGIRFIEARMDGQVLPLGDGAGQVEVSGSDPVKVTWHFAPTSNSSHTFALTYLAQGVVEKQSGADVLAYTALPTAHDYSIAASTVRVRYPSAARLQGKPGLLTGQASFEQGTNQVVYQASNLENDQYLEVRLEFAPGSLTANTPAWQNQAAVQAERNQRSLPVFLGLGAALLLGGGAGLWYFQRRFQPPAVDGFAISGESPIQPSDTAPAIVEALIQDGAPSANSLMAILFDLGQRGVLVIKEIPKKNWFTDRDFNVELRYLGGLRNYERTLLEYLYQTSNLTPGLTASLRKNGAELVSQWNKISPGIEYELRMLGWADLERQRTAKKWTLLAAGGAFAGVIAFILSFLLVADLGGWVVLIGTILMVLGIIWLVLAARLPKLSDRGLQEAAKWQGFRRYMNEITKGHEPAIRPDLFERYLPYASAFGIASTWAHFFQKRNIAQIPDWFRAISDSGVDSMGAFVSMLDTSSSSVSASGGDGGGGSAGGGSSSTG